MVSAGNNGIYDPWLDLHGTANVGEAAIALKIQTIEGVEPLDAQFDTFEKKTVPDKLYDVMFGQLDPTDPEVTVTRGDAIAVPSLQTYAILDAAKVVNLPVLLEGSGLEYRCLFKGGAYDEQKNVAPWVVKLENGNRFTRSLFTGPAGINGLWETEPGIYIRSRGTLDDIWGHFRRFTRFQNEHGKWFYFRFWEGSIFSAYWERFAASYPHVVRFFCSRDFKQSYHICFIHDGVLTHVGPDMSVLLKNPKKISPLSLTAEDHEFFQLLVDKNFKENIRLSLLKKLDKSTDEKKEHIFKVVDWTFNYIKTRNGGTLIKFEDCFTLSLLIILWGDAANKILRGALMNEPLISVSHKIKLARETFLEMINIVKNMRS